MAMAIRRPSGCTRTSQSGLWVSDDAKADKLGGLATVHGNPPEFRLALTKGVLDHERATVRRPENAQHVQLIQILRQHPAVDD